MMSNARARCIPYQRRTSDPHPSPAFPLDLSSHSGLPLSPASIGFDQLVPWVPATSMM